MSNKYRNPLSAPERDFSPFINTLYTSSLYNIPPKVIPNRYFTPIPDNRDQILEQIKKEQNQLLELWKIQLPPRT